MYRLTIVCYKCKVVDFKAFCMYDKTEMIVHKTVKEYSMKEKKGLKRLLLILTVCMLMSGVELIHLPETSYAATATVAKEKSSIVCGKEAKIKLPSGYKNATYTSSNTKVAMVSKDGLVKAVRLGVTNITAKAGAKKKTYTITVTPAKKTDVWLSNQMVFSDMSFALKLKSKKYDTSQVKLTFDTCDFETGKISKDGKSKGFNLAKKDYAYEYGDVEYSYGSFSDAIDFYIMDPSALVSYMKMWVLIDVEPQKIGKKEPIKFDAIGDMKNPTVKQLEKMGVSFYLDNKQKLGNTIVYPSGKHKIYIKCGNKYVTKSMEVTYNYFRPLMNIGVADSVTIKNKNYFVFTKGEVTEVLVKPGETFKPIKYYMDDKTHTVSDYARKGVTILIDGKKPKDKFTLAPGTHTYALKEFKQVKPTKFTVRYGMLAAIQTGNTKGWKDSEEKTVVDKCAEIYKEIIKNGMTDREKVTAIHDYLIYHADYTANGDLNQASMWNHSIGGLVLDGSAVCEGYARAFYLFCKAAGVDCEYVYGYGLPKTDDSSHAWNYVKVDGKWYYVDCTWDDPIGGHNENKKYFMSETLWPDHEEEGKTDFIEEDGESKAEYILVGDKNRYPHREK